LIQSRTLEIPTARVFKPLLAPARHKAAWGGRGSGKSYFFGGLLIEDSQYEKGLLSVCIREVQKDLKDSSKRLIEKLLIEHRLGEADGFKVFRERIETPGDGVMIFTGMQDHTSESIKSLEGFKRAWWEEAQAASKRSINLLTPTFRVKGSQLFWSWNARLKNDPIDVMFRGAEIPTDAVVVNANWRDNPWFHDSHELEQERQDCLRLQPDQYDHIWEGGYVTIAEGAYYAKQLNQARAQKRISRVAPDPLMTYRAYWDIGGTGDKADACEIVISQFIGREIRVLNHYAAVGQELGMHLNWLRDSGYESALCILPHDGGNHEKIQRITYEGAIKAAGFKTKVIPNQGAGAALKRVEAARRVFPAIWFNEDTTQPLRDSLGWYHEKRDVDRNVGLGPEHDWASHGADAFGMMCIDYETPKEAARPRIKSNHSFMGV
jgi:phage terminase large subunit